MSFRNPVTTIDAVRNPVQVAGGTINTVTGTVGSVAGDVGGNVAGSVASVENPVTAGGGHVDTVATVTNPVTPSGGSVGSVTGNVEGSVGSVAGNVIPDPASSILAVTGSVPTMGRDYWYWPAISGEAYAPARSSGTSYGSIGASPAYVNAGSSNAVVTFPTIPRTSGTKNTVTITGQIVSGPPTAVTTLIALGATLGLRFTEVFVSGNTQTQVSVIGADGTIGAAVNLGDAGASGTTMETYTYTLILHANGTVTGTVAAGALPAVAVAGANANAAPITAALIPVLTASSGGATATKGVLPQSMAYS